MTLSTPRLAALQSELSALRHTISTGQYSPAQYLRFIALARILNQAVL